MNYETSILDTVMNSLGVTDEVFKAELKLYINDAIVEVNQVGACNGVLVNDETTWSELINDEQDNSAFPSVMALILYRARTLFDPPPPSAVATYNELIEKTLWRIRAAYDVKG